MSQHTDIALPQLTYNRSDYTALRAHQAISQWMRPKTVRPLREEGVVTLGQLVDLIKRRGPGWWRSIPRTGRGRAEKTWRPSGARTGPLA